MESSMEQDDQMGGTTMDDGDTLTPFVNFELQKQMNQTTDTAGFQDNQFTKQSGTFINEKNRTINFPASPSSTLEMNKTSAMGF